MQPDVTDLKEVGVTPNDNDRHFAQVYWNLRSVATDMVAPNRLAPFFIRAYDDATSGGWNHSTWATNTNIFWPPWEPKIDFAKTDHAVFDVQFWKQGIGQSGGIWGLRNHCSGPGDCAPLGIVSYGYGLSPTGGDEGHVGIRLGYADSVPFLPIGDLESAVAVDDTSVEVDFLGRLWWQYIGEANYMVFREAGNVFPIDGPGGTDGILSLDLGGGTGQLTQGKGGIWQVAEAADLPSDMNIDSDPGAWFTEYCFAHERSGYSTNVKNVSGTAVLEWLPIVRGPGDADCDADGVDEDDCASDEFTTVYHRQGTIEGAPGQYLKNEFDEESDWGNGDATISRCLHMSDFTFPLDTNGTPLSETGTINLTTPAKYTISTTDSEFEVHTGGPPQQGTGITIISDQRRQSHALFRMKVKNWYGDARRMEQAFIINGDATPPTNETNLINYAINVSEANVGYRFKHRTAAVAEASLPIAVQPQGWDTEDGDLYRIVAFQAKDAEIFFDSENSDGSLQAWRIQTEDNTDPQVVAAAPHTSVMADGLYFMNDPTNETGEDACNQWHLVCAGMLESDFTAGTNCATTAAANTMARCRGHAQ